MSRKQVVERKQLHYLLVTNTGFYSFIAIVCSMLRAERSHVLKSGRSEHFAARLLPALQVLPGKTKIVREGFVAPYFGAGNVVGVNSEKGEEYEIDFISSYL